MESKEIYHLRSRYPCGIRYIPERVDNGDESVNVDEGEGENGASNDEESEIARFFELRLSTERSVFKFFFRKLTLLL